MKPPESTADMVRRRFNLGLDKADEDWIVKQIEEHVAEAVGRERERCAAIVKGWKGRRLEGHDDRKEADAAFGRGVDMASHYIGIDISAKDG